MKNTVFEEIAKNARKQLMDYRISMLEKMSLMTDDTTILKGLTRLRKQLSMTWKNSQAGKKERNKKYLDKAQLDTSAKASSHYRAWTEDDRLKVANLEMVDKDIALQLGRTLKSIRAVRQRLYKLGKLTK